MTIDILKPGMLSTIQDLGRDGHQQYGILANGVMDQYSARMANILVGNTQDEAVIECTLIGPTLKFNQDTTIAITGGSLGAIISSYPLPNWHTIHVKKDAIIEFKGCRSGCRTYVAIAGGIDIPEVLGSKSTYIRAKIGGFHGRPLQKNDQLCLKPEKRHNVSWESLQSRPHHTLASWNIDQAIIPHYDASLKIRVIAGAQYDFFFGDNQTTFFSNIYNISNQSDRMGYILSGIPLSYDKESNPISEAITFGAIQVPPNGQPIILMADRQSVGGYPKIVNVISADLPLLAQAKSGDSIKFQLIEIRKAQSLYITQIKELNRIESVLKSYFTDDSRISALISDR